MGIRLKDLLVVGIVSLALCVLICLPSVLSGGNADDGQLQDAQEGGGDEPAQVDRSSDYAGIDIYDTSEGVAVTVNGVDIGVAAKREYAVAFCMTDGGQGVVQRDAETDAVEYFINLELLRQEADGQGVSVSADKVRAECASLEAAFGNPAAFDAYLSERGLDARLFAMAVEYDLLCESLKGQMGAGAPATDEQVLAYLREQGGDAEDLSGYDASAVEAARTHVEERNRELAFGEWFEQVRGDADISKQGA